MRKLAFLIVIFASAVACGSEVAATGVTGHTDEPGVTTSPRETSVADVQPTATAATGQTQDSGVEEQRVRNIEFRLSELERLLSAGDGMFSLEDDLANADGRLRAQQRCINALVLAAGSHQHRSDIGQGITGPGQFGSFESFDLDSTSHAMMLAVECGPSVDESLLAQLADNYGIDVK